MNFFGIFKDKLGRSKIPILKSRLFWLGVIIKLTLSFFFASTYLSNKFSPFTNYFIESGFQNPYEFFVKNGNGTEFPYPPLMLWLLSIPRIIFWPIFEGNSMVFTIADSFLFRVPLLLADITILFVLLRWLKTKMRQVLVWYWLSPVLIYINYFHGQLDVLPIAILFISLYLLFKNKWIFSFIFFGFAIACKTNIVLVLPFYLIYLYKTIHISFKNILFAFASLIGVVLLINLPFINSEGFLKMVYNNPVQQQVFDLYYQFNPNLKIYFIPSVYFSLLLWYTSLKFVNRDQLILFLTFTFLLLTLMIAPMQGWYYWIMPFLFYFVIKQQKLEQQLIILLSALYFIYFAFAQNTDYHNSFIFSKYNVLSPLEKFNETKIPDIIFTLLQTTLILIGYIVYKKGIQGNAQIKFLSQPYMIGIGGDSAAGKSTLTNALSSIFEKDNTTIIRGDDMHKWERGNENWETFTHLDPKANNIHQEMNNALILKTGNRIKRSFYNHTTGKFNLPTFIKPNKLIIFEGLHSFYLKNQADIYDLKIFMNPSENLRIWWKVKRDVLKRGYTPEKVIEQLKKREEDSLKFIRSQSDNADIEASFYSLTDLDINNLEIEPKLGLKIIMSNNIYLEPLLDELKKIKEIIINHNYSSEKQEILFEGNIDKNVLENISNKLIPELEEVGIYNTEWKNNFEGLMQILIAYVVFKK